MLTFVLTLILASTSVAVPPHCTFGEEASASFGAPRNLHVLVAALEPLGWRIYQRCHVGTTHTVVLYHEGNSRHLSPGEAPGPPNNLIIGERRHEDHDQIAINALFAESSGDIGVCPVTKVTPWFITYVCLRGDAVSSSPARHVLRW